MFCTTSSQVITSSPEAKNLSAVFADEYVEYVNEYTAVPVDGHELTRICSSEKLTVVDVTQRRKTEGIPAG